MSVSSVASCGSITQTLKAASGPPRLLEAAADGESVKICEIGEPLMVLWQWIARSVRR